ncbi:MAG: GtrA family protein [Kineosporiaceae bacterium]
MSAGTGLIGKLQGALSLVYREALKFGAVGGIAYVVDTYVFNVLLSGWFPAGDAPLGHKPLTCKVISATVATIVAWLGNRYWTFRHRRRLDMRREFVLFALMNVAGIVIALSCLGLSHYAFGLDSKLADNISGNVVGLALGTLFRFWAYRTFVFRQELEAEEGTQEPAAQASPAAARPVARQDVA